ncbi:MAG: hypothetical protein JJ868_17035 [Shimia sp.]|uniref:hypothetical protein n=1 Tax=Shimia sp. TaxID=1954381 RepID=UPI001B067A49|nr:hypothetical protein [Shimia sp.]MBO6899077.1 hypothetical protein [Shimia sp.]
MSKTRRTFTTAISQYPGIAPVERHRPRVLRDLILISVFGLVTIGTLALYVNFPQIFVPERPTLAAAPSSPAPLQAGPQTPS